MIEGASRRNDRLIIFTISLAAFMGALDVTIVNISLPTLARNFQVSTSVVSWIILVYLLVLCAFLPTFGRLGDMKGFRKIFVAGFCTFTTGSLGCGLSQGFAQLILFRVIQATGAAMLSAIGPSMVSAYLPEKMRGRALGYVTTAASLGIAIGPVVGGMINQYWSWRGIFFINIPVGIIGVFFAMIFLPRIAPASLGKKFDLPGAALIFLTLFALLYALNMGHELGFTSGRILGSFGAAVVFGGLFIRQEARSRDPLINLTLFRNATFTIANLAGGLMTGAFTGAIFIFPFYLELIREISVSGSGIIMIVPSLLMMLSGPSAGHLADRGSSRNVTMISIIFMVIAFAMFFLLGKVDIFWFLILSLALMGAGIGAFLPPARRMILDRSPSNMEGISSGIMVTIRNCGSVLGVVILETAFSSVVGGDRGRLILPGENRGLLLKGFEDAFLAGLLLSLAALAVFAFVRRESRRANT